MEVINPEGNWEKSEKKIQNHAAPLQAVENSLDFTSNVMEAIG